MNKEIHKKLDSLYEEFNDIFTKLVKLELCLKDSKLDCYEWGYSSRTKEIYAWVC